MDTQEASRPLLETAQTHFQQKKYDLCLLSLHTLAQAGGTGDADAQALTVICKIHKHAALQEWHKVASNASLLLLVPSAKQGHMHTIMQMLQQHTSLSVTLCVLAPCNLS